MCHTFFVFTNDRFTENRNEIQSIINKRYYLFLRLALHEINNKFVFGAASRQPDKEYHQSQTFRVCIKERLTLNRSNRKTLYSNFRFIGFIRWSLCVCLTESSFGLYTLFAVRYWSSRMFTRKIYLNFLIILNLYVNSSKTEYEMHHGLCNTILRLH